MPENIGRHRGDFAEVEPCSFDAVPEIRAVIADMIVVTEVELALCW
jgi:hypothetical protein